MYLSASLSSYFPTFSPCSRHFCHCPLLMYYSDIYLLIPCFIFQTYMIPPGVSAFSASWMERHSFLAWSSSIKFLLLNATFPNSDNQNNQCETKKTIRFSPEYSVAFKKGYRKVKCMVFFQMFILPKSQPIHREYKVIYVWAQLSFKLHIYAVGRLNFWTVFRASFSQEPQLSCSSLQLSEKTTDYHLLPPNVLEKRDG